MASSPIPADDADGAPDAGPTARRILLGALLKRLRESAGVARADAAYEIRGSDSKMSRLESGKVSFKERDVDDLLKMYGVTDGPDRDRVLAMAQESNKHGWWQRYNEVIPSWFEDYVGLEASASRIQSYELLFVPGLLQTPDYARALVSGGRPTADDPDVEQRLSVRMQRQRILRRPDAPTLWAVVDESVLHRPIGGDDVLTTQLDHLLEMAALPSVVLQILPLRLSGYAAEHTFTLLRFAEPELPDLVYLEEHTGATYLDKRPDVESYSRIMDRLTIDALSPEASRRHLTDLRAER
ncbi:MAG: helix-turn-helix domain-containing protein [Actinomycetota bacterium]|nr:helix-turn-helix domain-containing protein [Actinomycetota bacterium]